MSSAFFRSHIRSFIRSRIDLGKDGLSPHALAACGFALLVCAAAVTPAQRSILVIDDPDPDTQGFAINFTGGNFLGMNLLLETYFEVVDIVEGGDAFDVEAYDAVFVGIRNFRDALTPAEAASLEAFRDSGKPMLLQGEGIDWNLGWNTDLASIVGAGEPTNAEGTEYSSLVEAGHPIAYGAPVEPVLTAFATRATGGVPVLTNQFDGGEPVGGAIISAFGPTDSVILCLDVFYFDQIFIEPGNRAIAERLVRFLAGETNFCSIADIAEPASVLDLDDITAFVTAFTSDGVDSEPADLAEPFGLLDLADIAAFVEAFLAGCP